MGLLFKSKKEVLLTYASTFNENLTFDMILEFFKNYFNNKKLKYDAILVRENKDEEILENHYHLWIKTEKPFSIGKKTWDIKLINPVIAVYKGAIKDGWVQGYLDWPKEWCFLPKNAMDNYEEIENYVHNNFGYQIGEWQILEKAHPNIQIKRYGCTEYMIDYVTKCIEISPYWSTLPIEELKAKYPKEKEFKQKEKKEKEEWPDFEMMKEDGMSIEQAKQYLIKKHPKWVIKHWNRCEAGFYLLFGNNNLKDYTPDLTKTYWVPLGVMQWYNCELLPYILNCDDEEWLNNNRTKRPRSLLWVGPSKIGKTSFCRSLANHNYFYAMIDGLESFNSNLPFSIFDDFPKEWHSFFSNWKPWMGSQTDFVVNPKYGRRRKLLWGHPSIFLANEMPELNKPGKDGYVINKSNEDYINKNVIIVESDKRYLWEEPPKSEQWKYVKVELKNLEFWKFKLQPEINEDLLYMPPATEAIKELIDAEEVRQEMIEKGRPKRELFYVEELPGYEGQTFKRRKTL